MEALSIPNDTAPKPVSKWIWPGILIALPVSVVVACIITAFFVVGHPDGLVASDYYKQGKAINALLVKQERATQLGMNPMRLERTSSGITVRFPQAQVDSVVEFNFAHPVDGSKDRRIVIAPVRRGVYEIPLTKAFSERRRVIATDLPAKQWRSEGVLSL